MGLGMRDRAHHSGERGHHRREGGGDGERRDGQRARRPREALRDHDDEHDEIDLPFGTVRIKSGATTAIMGTAISSSPTPLRSLAWTSTT